MAATDSIEDMTLGDLEWLEDVTQMPFSALDGDNVTAKQMSALAAIMIAKRDHIDRNTALDAARQMKLADMDALL